jgi:hypothetical protein
MVEFRKPGDRSPDRGASRRLRLGYWTSFAFHSQVQK